MPRDISSTISDAERLIAELALPNLKLQFDIYHRQILQRRRRNGSPPTDAGHRPHPDRQRASRHEPDGEELNYRYLFDEIDRSVWRLRRFANITRRGPGRWTASAGSNPFDRS